MKDSLLGFSPVLVVLGLRSRTKIAGVAETHLEACQVWSSGRGPVQHTLVTTHATVE